MWIITHDNVHEAGINPAGNVPKSHDYMTKATRKKASCRKHIFRLTKQGRELFRGVAYFENDAPFKEILRPLDEFGRSLYDCDGIEYQMRDLGKTPNGRIVWNKVPEEMGRTFDKKIGITKYYGTADHSIDGYNATIEQVTVSVSKLLKELGLQEICEVDESCLRMWFKMMGV